MRKKATLTLEQPPKKKKMVTLTIKADCTLLFDTLAQYPDYEARLSATNSIGSDVASILMVGNNNFRDRIRLSLFGIEIVEIKEEQV